MKHLMIAAAVLLASACTPPAAEEEAVSTAEPALPGVTLPVADQAGNRMEALTQNGAAWCTGGATPGTEHTRCVQTDNGEWQASFGGVAASIPVSGEGEVSGWPVVISSTLVARFYVGLVQTEQQMYSGGGGSAARVTLYEVTPTDPGFSVAPLVTLPLSGEATIRACFDAEDEAQRAGACQDHYSFVTRITLDESVTDGAPRFILETVAGSYPGRVTRNADSLEAPPLTQADLVWARDPTCSFRRTYSRGADGLYSPDQPLPACADYLEP